MDKYKTFTIALPDTDKAAPIASRISSIADYRFNHKSGRPWLFSRQIDAKAVVHSDTPNPVAIIGSVDLNEDQLYRLNTTIKAPYQLQNISKEVAGSFLVFGSIDGTLYANGPAFQSKRLFSAVICGIRILSDRADLLADLGEFQINPTKLGLRMVRGLPNPADGLPVWDEIDELPGWEYLTLSSDGRSYQTHRWWEQPRPNLDRNEAALGLREALRQSVQARISRNSAITCDLSGGLDSTPICYFASTLTEKVYAHTYYTNDPGGREDLTWAKLAIKSMPMLKEHQVFSNEHMPDFFEKLTEVVVPMDFPSAAAGTVPRLAHMLGRDKELGTSMHLNGIGGDHLLRGVKLWNHSIARKHPLLGWKRARAEDSPDGISAVRTFRELLNRHSYSKWLMQSVDLAFSEHNQNDIPRTSDWSVPISAPNWLTARYSDSIHQLLSDIAKKATPLGETHAGHFDIQTVLHATALTRAMEQIGHFLGVPYEAPLLDDHVVNAVLATKHEVRDTPIEWKPLMKTAMDGLLPADYLRRTSKIGGAPQAVRGFAKHREELSNLWQSSGIFNYEIIDQRVIKENTKPSATAMPSSHVSTLNNVALFLSGINS